MKIWVSLSLKIYCKEIIIHNSQQLKAKGPLIIASNHPNSFFDAILIGRFMNQPVFSLARGDMFQNSIASFILRKFKMLPIYRMLDEKQNLSLNEQTFKRSEEILRSSKLMLIFVEGVSDHQTTLLPLKKGAPRIITNCWRQGTDVKILPVWLRYNSFFSFGKLVEINFGGIFGKEVTNPGLPESKAIHLLDNITAEHLVNLSKIHAKINRPAASRFILFLPAAFGVILHSPLYIPAKFLIKKLTHNTPNYDGVMFATLTVLYPFYVLFLSLAVLAVTKFTGSFILLILLPLSAYSYTLWKK